ncbi:transglycosylase family protein [Streptomyces sp. NPDC000594]|uniref:transglycosylase family protein n=1 Tax=Streptomyces sp. NPDC000594 TaxID=3154261 RepID=UPI0033274A6C
MAGSAIALPLLGAGSATAAETTAWDRVAECESGGAWSADTGNGYYGGLQISQNSWEAYGGLEYASRPDLASRAHQIAVAEKVLAAEGAKAWASCAEMAGLTTAGTGGAEDQGAKGTAAKEPGTKDTEDSATKGSAAKESTGDPAPRTGKAGGTATEAPEGSAPGTAEKTEKATGTGGSGGTGAEADREAAAPARTEDGADTTAEGKDAAGKATGKHRGPAADESADTAGRAELPATGGSAETKEAPGATGAAEDRATDTAHPSRSGADRTEVPAAGDTTATGTADTSPSSYTVRPGDNLSVIVEERKLDGGWSSLYERNKDTVGEDPDLIHPGQSLDLSATPK